MWYLSFIYLLIIIHLLSFKFLIYVLVELILQA